MKKDGSVNIKIGAQLSASLKRVLGGVRKETDGLEKHVRSESKKTTEQVKKNVADRLGNARAALKKEGDAFRKNEENKRREVRKTTRAEEQEQRKREREWKKATQAQKSMWSSVRAGLKTAGGIGIGAAYGAASVVGRAQGALGVEGRDSLVNRTIAARRSMIIQGASAGFSQEQIDELFKGATEIARANTLDPGEVIQGFVDVEELFSSMTNAVESGNVQGFMDQMAYAAKVANATGSAFSEVVAAQGEFQRQFGLSAQESADVLAILSEQATQGSLSLGDFAKEGPKALASFISARGANKVDSIREFGAVMQQLRAGGLNAMTSAQRARAFLDQITDVNVMSKLRSAGVEVWDKKSGHLKSIPEIISMLADKNFDARELGRIFTSSEMKQAVNVLVNQELQARQGIAGRSTLQEYSEASLESGRSLIETTNAMLAADVSGAAMRVRTGYAADIFSQSKELIAQNVKLAEKVTELQGEFPQLTTAIGDLTRVITAAGAGGVISKLLGAGKGGGAAGGGGVVGSFKGAGLLGKAGMVASVIGSGIVGYELGEMLNDKIGEMIGSSAEEGGLGGAIGRWLADDKDAFAEEVRRENEARGISQADVDALARAFASQKANATPMPVELTDDSARKLAAAAAATSPGSGRRTDGGPGGR